MIETLTAENGSSVLRDSGRWLASSVNPQAEARDWLSRRREFLDKVQFAIVLGAGAGYHILELAQHTSATLLVLEINPAVVSAVRSIHAFDTRKVKFIEADGVRQLRANDDVRAAVAQSFVVLQHGPSLAGNPQLYREMHAQLIGRDWGALNWQWQMKGLAALESSPQIHKTAEPLSILDLEQTELVRDSEERERMLIKALRELVK